MLEEIDVKESTEYWNYYRLEDNAVLRLKIVLIKVVLVEPHPNGNPGYSVMTMNAISVKPGLSSYTDTEPINDIAFEVQKESWNEYTLIDGVNLLVKPAVVKIDKTGQLDPMGMPIYTVQLSVLVKCK